MVCHFFKQYLHALSNHIFVVDPLQGSNEVEDSRKAGYKFGLKYKVTYTFSKAID